MDRTTAEPNSVSDHSGSSRLEFVPMPSTCDNVLYEAADRIAWITVNNPDKLNALDRATVGEIAAAGKEAQDDASIRVIVLTGAGGKAFVAGADIKEMASLSPLEAQSRNRRREESFRSLKFSMSAKMICQDLRMVRSLREA